MRLLNETKEITIRDCSFTIGVIDRRRFHGIKTRFLTPTKFLANMTPDQIKAMTPAELGQKAVEGLTPEQIHKNEELAFGAQWDLAKYGVRAHAIKDKEGKEIPIVKDDGGCLADDTLALYDFNNLLAALANEIFVFNTLSEDQKKN